MTTFGPSDADLRWMQIALSLAQNAASIGEVPVGAVIVSKGKLLSTGFNLKETIKKPTAHAELLAIEEACQIQGSWRLSDCSLYVSLEPCLMCAGAIYQSRIGKVCFGAFDPKGGALGSLYELHLDKRLNHRYQAFGGLLAEESSALLSSFFAKRRQQNKMPKLISTILRKKD